MNRHAILSASVMCVDLARLGDEVRKLEDAGVDELHFDIMDGRFVPNITLGFPIIKACRPMTSLPLDVHLMVTDPTWQIPILAELGVNSVSFHVELPIDAEPLLNEIREAGMEPGLSLNPATDVETLRDLLPLVDHILLMTVNPGFAGQKIVPDSFRKAGDLLRLVGSSGREIVVGADGNISLENGARLAEAGVRRFVLGTSALFVEDGEYRRSIEQFRAAIGSE